MKKHTGGIIDNSMRNGLQMNLKDAMEDVGAIVPESACLWEYPEIIRQNLIAKTITNVNIIGSDIINISKSSDNTTYNISTLYDTTNITRPIYSKPLNNSTDKLLSVDKIFDDLFKNILPEVRGVHSGDITTTDLNGTDNKLWINTLFNTNGVKHGLNPNSKYLRLYLTCQSEPIYILINSDITDLTNGYNVKNSDTITFEIDNTNMTLTANIACITQEQINSIN